MNKRGFTLVEIIVTIGLLAILGVGIGFSLNKVIKKQEENSYEEFISKVKSSSLLYSSNNTTVMNNLEFNYGYVLIPTQDLIDNGYVRENLKNPNTNETLKDLSINEKGEDYSRVRIYYSMDKEMIVDYPFIKPTADIYLNVINYTTIYNTNEKDLCYKGLNTPSLGLTLVESGGLLDKSLKVGETIIAYMEDGSKCDDTKLNTGKIGVYKVRYLYTTDGTNVENNPNAKSAERSIIIKPTKPHISNFDVVPQDDSSVYIAHFTGEVRDDSGLKLEYCYNYDNDKINDCENWKTINNNIIDESNIDLHDIDKNVESKSQMKFYLFVKNPFEEYDVRQMSSNNGVYILTSTLVLNLKTHKDFDEKIKFYTNINMNEEIPQIVTIEKITNNSTLSEVLGQNNYKKYKKPITRSYYFNDWVDDDDNIFSENSKIFGVVNIYANWLEDKEKPECKVSMGNPLSVAASDTGGSNIALEYWSTGNKSLSTGQHIYTVIDFAGNSVSCGISITNKKKVEFDSECPNTICASQDCDCPDGGSSFCCCYVTTWYPCKGTKYVCPDGHEEYSNEPKYCWKQIMVNLGPIKSSVK